MSHTYAIIGTGAVGGYYGAKLQKAGFNVHFLLNTDYHHVKEQGLIIESPEGNFVLSKVNAHNHTNTIPPCDIIIITLKSTKNYLLPQLLPPILKPNSIILLLQNGLGIEPELIKILDTQTLLAGLCFLCSNKMGPGHIRHLNYGEISIGEYQPNYQPAGITLSMMTIVTDLELANIKVNLVEDLFKTRWIKLVWNIPFNGLSVVLGAKTDDLILNQDSQKLIIKLMKEVIKAANSCGCELEETLIDTMLDMTAKMSPYRTSMKIDYDRNVPLEVETMVGIPKRMAQLHGIELPLLDMLYQQLKFIDWKIHTY